MITTPVGPELLRGALDTTPGPAGLVPHRLPPAARARNTDPQLAGAESQPSGVRVVFRTTATVVELETVRTRIGLVGAPLRPDGAYDLLVDGRPAGSAATTGGRLHMIDPATGAREITDGPAGSVRFPLPGRDALVEIWLPHNELTEVVALRTDAPLAPVPAGEQRVWLHHGSSISQGSNAAGASTTWAAVAARAAGVELLNLGFSGSCLLDPFVARAIRDTPADLISLKLGINVVNADLMRVRAFGPAVHGFLDTIRDGHPDTPLLVVSPVLCPIHEDTPGPLAPDVSDGTLRFRATGDPAEVAAGRLTLRVVREQLAAILAARVAEDPHLSHLDGRELYGEADAAELPLPDDLHPDAATHERMGERFAARVFGAGGAFADR
ncbi:GDSL-like Lipase/Acylhydrolase family protein [Pseudonocardia ammonioxydans]|uniref:GDSL-like Lipase/Acylhydrolase family protein n=1 Tax=Pseudonocardia ammonioxydans TaxID=260086 RepID=A0A1I5DH89_PSUAM|nr:SGNH/GDSL hydrolase family protein [Pseudonocardia ammonioxydans]SFN98497.1 GDSL-like Lipase/Acylhydrolase family protein [Pseudonocardia ammonioxydans]